MLSSNLLEDFKGVVAEIEPWIVILIILILFVGGGGYYMGPGVGYYVGGGLALVLAIVLLFMLLPIGELAIQRSERRRIRSKEGV